MIDAERIAAFISNADVMDAMGGYGPADATWVESCLSDPEPGVCMTLAAMLADVRREEREAALEVAASIADGYFAGNGLIQPVAGYIAKAIRVFIGKMR